MAFWGGEGGAGEAEEKRSGRATCQLVLVRPAQQRKPRTWDDLHCLKETSRSVLEDEDEERSVEIVEILERRSLHLLGDGVPEAEGKKGLASVQERPEDVVSGIRG